jgi:magnesium transporter
MFRAMEFSPGQPVRISEGAASCSLPAAGTLRWLDLSSHDRAELEVLQQCFGFHPLAIENCAQFDQRPNIEEFGDHVFIVTQGLRGVAGAEQAAVQELHAFIGPGYLVTVHEEPIPAIEAVWRRVAHDASIVERGPGFVYYLVMDTMVDDDFPVLDRIAEELEQLEEVVLTRPRQFELPRLFRLRHLLLDVRRVVTPQRDVAAFLSRHGTPWIGERATIYFRDVYDHLVRLHESIEAQRELLGNVMEAYRSAQSNRTNEIMKRLTLMSAVFLPLTFITGFFGQNFEHLPFASLPLMLGVTLCCFLLPAVMLWWFYSRDWF